MKVRNDVKPISPYEIEIHSDISDILLYENIEEIEEGENIVYSYDLYIISVPTSTDLPQRLEDNFDSWIELAREQEQVRLREQYCRRVEELVAGKYTLAAEVGILSDREEDPEAFDEHHRFVRECKNIARVDIYGE